jgi:hypothetical protein
MAAGLTAFIMSRKGADAALSRMNAAKGQVVRHVEDRSQREESLSGDDHHGDAMG